MIKPVDYTKQEHFTDPKQLTLTSKMELLIKGLVLCLIALAGVYHADAADAVLTLTSPTGKINVGDKVTFTCTIVTAAFVFKKGTTTITALIEGSRYTTSSSSGVLTFVAKESDTVAKADGWTCEGTTATAVSAKVGLTVEAATTTTTTMKATTAGSGSGSGGINGLPLAVMIFAVLFSFFLRH